MKHLFLFVCLMVIFPFGFSQQIPQYSQWYWNQFAHNPAHAGIKPCVDIRTAYRNQWNGFEGAPNSGFLTFAAPLYTKKKRIFTARQGVGFKFERDQIGPFTANRLNLNYAFHQNFTPDDRLSIGIGAGVQQWIFDKAKTTTLVPDAAIAESNSAIAADAQIGFWLNGKNYYGGLVFNQLPRGAWGDIGTDSRFRFHTALNGGYRFLFQETWSLIPQVMMRIPPKGPSSIDVALVADYANKIGMAVGLRNQESFVFGLNFKFKQQVTISYSFDFVFSPVIANRQNTHEIGIAFSGCKASNKSKTVCAIFE